MAPSRECIFRMLINHPVCFLAMPGFFLGGMAKKKKNQNNFRIAMKPMEQSRTEVLHLLYDSESSD